MTISSLFHDLKNPLVWIGLTGQALFSMRFLIQWISSERQKKSVIPMLFWYFSLGGSLLVLIYGIGRADIVIILGQTPSSIIYIRNIMLSKKNKNE